MHPDARRWFERRTSAATDWPVDLLAERKGATTVSVVLPALDEEPTVGGIVEAVRALAERTGLVDEVVVLDSGSADRTAEVAAAAGATVHHRDDVLPRLGSYPGKGEVLWKALHVTSGDVIVYVDADLTGFGPHYVTGLLGPLLTDPAVLLTKAFYDRPLLDVSAAGGGRVTELMARPLLQAYLPALAGVVQPLAGEYAARRSLLETLPFAAGYGVETGLLLDTVAGHGLDAVAQVDLGHRTHGHQDTAALGRMAAAILRTVLSRVDPGREPWPELTQFRRDGAGAVEPHDTAVALPDRPPMIGIPEYRAAS
ncbi:MAG TPA: glucosyl-3-phosphoglycerate synthase [Mycobacteriales bacterium]|nr:glycosyl transferase family 2 [Cryptosporangiaceae bacterium]MDQ1675947.1 glucosyl-3-phosphoglycerate synthase [Actinomycetota bacterium]HEV7754280.1 glucosyl-3-phosphoglycerate synthase [Mycobacteriales bacterium]